METKNNLSITKSNDVANKCLCPDGVEIFDI